MDKKGSPTDPGPFKEFEIGIGWNTWGRYHTILKWIYSFTSYPGYVKGNSRSWYKAELTILGFFFRLQLFTRNIKMRRRKR